MSIYTVPSEFESLMLEKGWVLTFEEVASDVYVRWHGPNGYWISVWGPGRFAFWPPGDEVDPTVFDTVERLARAMDEAAA